ncbi:MAG: DUF4369 domain-containing protein [Bacteroidales bacterium]|nr:DUF4369 domain-containing protein [Bacteroidales bacterium]NPV35557.1 DUF4369 domain-containing protein [Bacteroidales bacterium]
MKILTQNTLWRMWQNRSLFSQIILAGLVWVLASSCHRKNTSQVSSIMGMMQSSGKTWVKLAELDAHALIPKDSVITGSDGSFVFAISVDEPSFYQLTTPKSDPLTLVVKPGDKIVVEGNVDKLLWARIRGSDESILLQHYLQESRLRLDTAEYLVKRLTNNSSSPKFIILRDSVSTALEELYQRHRNFTIQFIQDHPGTFAGLIAINQPFGRRSLFDPYTDRHLFLAFDSSLMRNYPQSKHTLLFHQRITEMQKAEAIKNLRLENLKPGKPIPEFRIPSLIEGQWVSPAQFKGKPLLIVFWEPAEGKQVQKLMQLHKKLRLVKQEKEVLCIAFDTQSARWQNAVKNAGLRDWHHGSDLRGTASPVYELFFPDNRPRPHFILSDAKGTILITSADQDAILKAIKNQ